MLPPWVRLFIWLPATPAWLTGTLINSVFQCFLLFSQGQHRNTQNSAASDMELKLFLLCFSTGKRISLSPARYPKIRKKNLTRRLLGIVASSAVNKKNFFLFCFLRGKVTDVKASKKGEKISHLFFKGPKGLFATQHRIKDSKKELFFLFSMGKGGNTLSARQKKNKKSKNFLSLFWRARRPVPNCAAEKKIKNRKNFLFLFRRARRPVPNCAGEKK